MFKRNKLGANLATDAVKPHVKHLTRHFSLEKHVHVRM